MNLLQENAPLVFEAYMSLIANLEKNCPLEPKVRELILIAILTVTGSAEGLKRHVTRALESGGTKDEILTAIISPLPMAGIGCVQKGLTAAMEVIGNT